jgi:hypothetical protein
VLTQKDEQGDENLVMFMSTGLQGDELNYPLMEKQAFVVHEEIKQFRSYILKNHTKFIVPHLEVRSLFVKKELGERQGNWMMNLQEYDLELKPTNIVKFQGFCKLVTQGDDAEEQEEDGWQDEPIMYTQQVPYVPSIEASCYNDIKYYLQYGITLNHLNAKHKRALWMKYLQYQLLHGMLFRNNYYGVLLRYARWTGWWSFLRRHNGLQSVERNILLAHTLQGCSCILKELRSMSKRCREGTQSWSSSPTCSSERTFRVVGPRYHW